MKLLARRVGRNIQIERKVRGYKTQGDFAEALKVDTSTVARWESGVSLPEEPRLQQIMKVLKMSEADLLRDPEATGDMDGVINYLRAWADADEDERRLALAVLRGEDVSEALSRARVDDEKV